MNVRIAGRGHSFKGAGLYYLHDKDAQTKERVGFTHVHNIQTDDPGKAINMMIYTANNADHLKDQAGIKKTGAKRTQGPVYTYSLNYEPDRKPTKEQMVGDAQETLRRLGLEDHQAVFIEHTDTDHPHLHIMANLINPNDGRVHVPSWSKLKCSDWALEKEREQGAITSPEREINNAKRKNGGFVKYKEKPHDRKVLIQQLYEQSDSGKAFRAALEDKGLALCQGDRRGWVLVDKAGKIHSLSRQLDKDQRKTLNERLETLDREMVPMARDVSKERLDALEKQPEPENPAVKDQTSPSKQPEYWDRDAYHVNWEEGVIDAAIKVDQDKQEKFSKSKSLGDHKKTFSLNADPKKQALVKKTNEKQSRDKRKAHSADNSDHLEKHDKLTEWNKIADLKRHNLETQLEETHGYKSMLRQRAKLEKAIESSDTFFGRLTGKHKSLQEDLGALNFTIKNSEMRIKEAHYHLESELAKTKPQGFGKNDGNIEIIPPLKGKLDHLQDLRERFLEENNKITQNTRHKEKDLEL